MNENIKLILQTIPEKPGVYQHIDGNGTIIYVGKAKNLKRRVNSYFNKQNDNLKTRQLVKHIEDIKYIVVENEQDAFLLENNLIKKYQPKYNILLKDGKSYPSICITKELYPRVYKTRNIDKKTGEYFGPYTYSNTIDLLLELVHQLYPIRTCSLPLTKEGIEKGKYKLCLKYHIKNCCGVCENRTKEDTYNEYIDEIRKIIKGNADEILKQLNQKMKEEASEMRYEEAERTKQKIQLIVKFQTKNIISNTIYEDTDAFGYIENDKQTKAYISYLKINKGSIVQGINVEYNKKDETKEEILERAIIELRERFESEARNIISPFEIEQFDEKISIQVPKKGDKLLILKLAQKNALQLLADKINQGDKLNPTQKRTRVLEKLQTLLHLDTLPVHIESFDNSNIQGTNAIGACVVFRMGVPSKKEYRTYNIKTVEGANDYESMKEVAYRRYKRMIDEKEELPDLIIADGGKIQMRALREATEEQLGIKIAIAGLVKDNKHRTSTLLYGENADEIGVNPTDELFKFLTQIQDEVHRFAIKTHKNKRSKSQTRSELDEIKGIGEKTKKMLIDTFKSLKRIKEADYRELEKAIGTAKATIIYEYFHGRISV